MTHADHFGNHNHSSVAPLRADYLQPGIGDHHQRNPQPAADQAHGFIVDVETVNDPQDASQLPAAMERVKRTFGRYPRQALADGGAERGRVLDSIYAGANQLKMGCRAQNMNCVPNITW